MVMDWFIKSFEELSAKEIYEILKSRAEIFVMEQGIHSIDMDDVDYESYHVFGMEDNRIKAYLRAYRSDDNFVKIGRVLTLIHGIGLGTELMKYAIKKIPEKIKCDKIIMDAQKHAVPFYEKIGFVITSGEYLEAGIVHVNMELKVRNNR